MMINSGKLHAALSGTEELTTCYGIGEFYGPNLSTANLELLARFFEKYPEYADKTFLSVKVCRQFM
jgi:hypothetical protein